MKARIKRLLNRAGLDLVRYRRIPAYMARRAHLLGRFGVTLVLDVGANAGIYGQELRKIGYAGRIVSFEPLSSAYAALASIAAADPAWEAVHLGLGDAETEASINVAGNSWSSSIRPMLDRHERVEPASRYVGCETIRLATLDSVFDRYVRDGDRVWLKIDTQGYERNVLAGALRSLPRIEAIQLEMSLSPLYEGEMLFPEMYQWLLELGYECVHLDPSLIDPQSEALLQLDGYFHRRQERPGRPGA